MGMRKALETFSGFDFVGTGVIEDKGNGRCLRVQLCRVEGELLPGDLEE
jgi:hypothetical protein